MDAAAEADPENRHGTDPPPNDAFETRVVVDGHTVTVVSGGDPPPEFERLETVCAGLIQRHKPR